MFETRKYTIIPASSISDVNFSEVLETAADTCRYSVDGSQTFVKWEGEEMPVSVSGIAGRSEAYSHDEILEILSSNEWTLREEEVV